MRCTTSNSNKTQAAGTAGSATLADRKRWNGGKVKSRLRLRVFTATTLFLALTPPARAHEPIDIGSRRELFVDRHLLDKLDGARLKLHAPRDAGKAFVLDRPWEGFGGYPTVIQNDGRFQLFYRGKTGMTNAGNPDETTCYAESADGIRWTRPDLRLFKVHGTLENNVILDNSYAPACHNFAPFVDTRPGVPADQRYKALAGTFHHPKRKEPDSGGLLAFVSADGIRWKKLREKAVIDASLHPNEHTDTCAPSIFWSDHEQRYVCYLRTWTERTAEKNPTSRRWIGRTTSLDFVKWAPIKMMEYQRDDGQDQLYLPNTFPYFRAPHIYLAITARLSDHRQVLTTEQAKAAGIPRHSWRDTSDVVFMTSRGGLRYDRTFRSSYIRPGLGTTNWASRANFPALGVVQTGPSELSLYVSRDYMTPSAHLRRYVVRLDGFASVHAPYEGGEMITQPLRFEGDSLQINFSTSASGWIRCEIQDIAGKPIPGYSLDECRVIGGDEIERTVTWKETSELGPLANQPIRLRFVMKDADLYSFQFTAKTRQ